MYVQASGNQRHITMPDGNRRDHFLKWIEELSDRQTPSWLGLPNNAEKVNYFVIILFKSVFYVEKR